LAKGATFFAPAALVALIAALALELTVEAVALLAFLLAGSSVGGAPEAVEVARLVRDPIVPAVAVFAFKFVLLVEALEEAAVAAVRPVVFAAVFFLSFSELAEAEVCMVG
jgi:hypothetical protein